MGSEYGLGLQLNNIDETTGAPPTSRLTDVWKARSIVDSLIQADWLSAQTRARMDGMIDGNQPYSQQKRDDAGQSYLYNFNPRIAERFVANAVGAIYDIATSGEYFAECCTAHDQQNPKWEQWNQIITKHFQWLNKKDSRLDYVRQMAFRNMIIYGRGPRVWQDPFDFRATFIKSGDVLVPARTKANVEDWEICAIMVDYSPCELFNFIRNKESAENLGWRTQATTNAIVRATPPSFQRLGEMGRDAEYWQSQLRNNDLAYSYSAEATSIQTAHLFWREYPFKDETEGRISHAIITKNWAQVGQTNDDFLFYKVGRFKNWKRVICPGYYDRGTGEDRSVKGLGIKMFGILDLLNKSICAHADSMFDTLAVPYQPTSPDAQLKASIIMMGTKQLIPFGMNPLPVHQASDRLGDALEIHQELNNILETNLASYRQFPNEKEGNPVTKGEFEGRMQIMATLANTDTARWQEQEDAYFEERLRRAANPNMTKDLPCGEMCMEFQKRCFDDGVPPAALVNMEYVRAYRTTGQGSAQVRQMLYEKALTLIGAFPDKTKTRFLQDALSSILGRDTASRYPIDVKNDKPTPDTEVALKEDVLFNAGAANTNLWVNDQQDHIIHIQTHLMAGTQALQSLQKGANSLTIISFADSAGPNIMAHLEAISHDPTRKNAADALNKQFEQFAKIVDEVKQKQQQTMQQQQAQQAKSQQRLSAAQVDTQIKAQLAKSDMARKNAKAQQAMQLKQAQAEQKMKLSDASVASDIHRKTAASLVQKPQR